MLKNSLIAKTQGKANDNQIKIIDNVRITYLTSRMLRVEVGNFTDDASYAVWFRKFDVGYFHVMKVGCDINVETDDIILVIRNKKPYSVFLKNTRKTELFSKQKNLKGTYRTLDNCYGKILLNDGLITQNGVYLFKDTSVLLNENGNFTQRSKASNDYYVFAYGKDYRAAINAFYKISGSPALIPRFALGVWWSRYHAYTQQEYLDLMKRFKREGIPLTVATIDMDWHWVHNIKDKFGVNYGGWTGYSWNTELFPNYKEFLNELKAENLHITLNLHPADGVHSYEDMYKEMASAVKLDPGTLKTVDFQCGSDDFWNAYFDVLHKPYERDGVDFWWIDWQQGKKSDVKDLDPLNALNHYHFLDNGESGQMPLILSRYAGLGSHRYPLGFSGDTAINWKVLDFQPYFTINAANAAYTWWSHDIGGHMDGCRDDDLYMRWLEFGVLSPIMRLHSTADELLGKEPWKYRKDIYECSKKWLNFRHKLIPYIHTMNHRTHSDGIALCEPMYYSYPENSQAYEVSNQYMFGSELMVCPITSPQDKNVNLGAVEAWIPQGRWTDIATNQVYEGEQKITLYRDIDTIPVLAGEGAIIPLSADDGNSCDNPQKLTLLAFSGNGEFDMIEDNGQVDYAKHKAVTKFMMKYNDNKLTFKINAVSGDASVVPEKRSFRVVVRDLLCDGEAVELVFKNVDITKAHTKTVNNVSRVQKEDDKSAVIRLMSRWQEKTLVKNAVYKHIEKLEGKNLMSAIDELHCPKAVKGAVKEHFSQV